MTIYTNLGESGVIHGLSETQAEVVITSHELLPKFKSILKERQDNVKTIVYMENPIKKTDVTGFRDDVRLISFWDVISLGKKTQCNNNLDEVRFVKYFCAMLNIFVQVTADPVSPSPDTSAIIMYTSGSTGTPKGVKLTHRSMVTTLNGFLYCLDPRPDDIYIAYLPLAHVLELVGGESMMIVWGVSIGYR